MPLRATATASSIGVSSGRKSDNLCPRGELARTSSVRQVEACMHPASVQDGF